MRSPFLRTSMFATADAFRSRPNAPLRGLVIGKFVILWDGKPGDYIETFDTDQFFDDKVAS